ncbi:MAG: hypothetical protein E7311_04285 [Clostridiales bacterium]|nr:hypothetical protein [Clostridiales bacterium]
MRSETSNIILEGIKALANEYTEKMPTFKSMEKEKLFFWIIHKFVNKILTERNSKEKIYELRIEESIKTNEEFFIFICEKDTYVSSYSDFYIILQEICTVFNMVKGFKAIYNEENEHEARELYISLTLDN